jgi:pilus assembly protein CpaF
MAGTAFNPQRRTNSAPLVLRDDERQGWSGTDEAGVPSRQRDGEDESPWPPSLRPPASSPPLVLPSLVSPPHVPLATARSSPRDDFGPLARYLADPNVTDLFVNGVDGAWIDAGDGLRRVEHGIRDERELRALAVRLIALGGRHIDETSPCVDVRLRGGIRVHAVLPPISTAGTLLSVRVPRRERFRLPSLRQSGMLTQAQFDRLEAAILARENILVTGAAGTGKTTLLSALLADAPHDERIVAIEDVAELRVEHPHFVSLESRQANLEGAGEVGMVRLVREALRMRPDRLVLGECRGAEIRELLAALNTGHDGGAGTLHANSLSDVPARIEALGALAGMSQEAIARQTVSAIGLILHLERRQGMRRLVGTGRFRLDTSGRLEVIAE